MQAALPDPPRVREALERVYARPEFAPREPGLLDPVREAIDRFWSAVGRFLTRVAGDGSAEWFLWLVVVLLAALGLAIVGYFVHQTLRGLRDARPARGEARAARNDARARTAPEWEALASRLAGEGRFREAALALYQGLLLRLESAGALRYDPAKTPGDYRREARPHPGGRTLGAFLRAFEPVAFGGREIGADGFERLRAAAAGEG